jgi:hypothetical protein
MHPIRVEGGFAARFTFWITVPSTACEAGKCSQIRVLSGGLAEAGFGTYE